jgi:hypothetical protein
MSLKSRLQRLERNHPPPLPWANEERLARLQALLAYQGNDPDMLDRRRRILELFQRIKARIINDRRALLAYRGDDPELLAYQRQAMQSPRGQ